MARTVFFAQASATASRATAVFTTAVDFANTPPDNSSILYIGSVELQASAAGFIELRLQDNTNTSSYAFNTYRYTQIVSAENVIAGAWGIISYGASPPSQSISIDVRTCINTTELQRSNANIVGLVLGANDQFVISTDTFTSGVAIDAFTTIGSQLDVSVATSSRWLVLTYAETSAPGGGDVSTAAQTKFMTIVDGSNRKTKYIDRVGAGANKIVDMWTESWTAGSHRVNLAETFSATSGAGWSRRVRHCAIELSAFAYSYIDESIAGVSGDDAPFVTVKSFTPNITETKQHLILLYANPEVLATGADVQTRYTRILKNTEDIGQINVGSSTNQSVAGGFGFPFIIPIVATVTSGTENNFSLLQQVETSLTAGGIPYHLSGHTFVLVQTADASVAGSAGGSQTTAKSVAAVGTGVASVIKTIGANRTAVGRGVASATKTVGMTKEAVGRAIAASDEAEILNVLLSAVNRNVASVAFASQFRATLEAVATAIASISSRTTRSAVLAAVTNVVATFSQRTTHLGNFVAVANAIASTIKRVVAIREAVGQAVADNDEGFFHSETAIAQAIAELNDATVVTASAGAPVADVPYVLSLGDSVKRFRSVIQYAFGIGKGSVSDRDPDT